MFAIFKLSGTKPKLNEELNIQDNGVATTEIDHLAIDLYRQFLEKSNFLIIEISVLFPRKRLAIAQMNNVEGGHEGIIRFRRMRNFFS